MTIDVYSVVFSAIYMFPYSFTFSQLVNPPRHAVKNSFHSVGLCLDSSILIIFNPCIIFAYFYSSLPASTILSTSYSILLLLIALNSWLNFRYSVFSSLYFRCESSFSLNISGKNLLQIDLQETPSSSRLCKSNRHGIARKMSDSLHSICSANALYLV